MKTIAFFNNKGGVGKTTLVYHVSWMLAEIGYVVLAADFDPQANLTSMFLDETDLERIWGNGDGGAQTVFQAVEKLKRGVGDISPMEPWPVERREGLYLLPGDLGLSDFESDLSEQWPKCVDRDERAFRVTSSFSRIVQTSAAAIGADLAIIDVGPNLGAINRTALIASDHVIVPLMPDIFSLQGLRNMGPRLRRWREEWAERIPRNPARDLSLPPGTMKPSGYVMMRHAVRLDRPARWFGKWIDKMPAAYRRDVLGDISAGDDHKILDINLLGELKDYKSLMPMAQEANKPMFALKPADGAIGGHQSAVSQCYRDFHTLAAAIARRCDLPPVILG